MTLQTSSFTQSTRTAATMPASELLRMVADLRRALEIDPQSAPEIAMGFLRRVAPCESEAPVDTRGGLAPWQKKKIGRHLKENLERSIRMEELAAEVKLSVSHFCRAFKKSFGETPHAHVVRLRLERAQSLMLTTDDPLSQIALSCGLADQAHLSKLFRRAFQDTPNAWRRRNLTEAQAESRCFHDNSTMRNAA